MVISLYLSDTHHLSVIKCNERSMMAEGTRRDRQDVNMKLKSHSLVSYKRFIRHVSRNVKLRSSVKFTGH